MAGPLAWGEVVIEPSRAGRPTIVVIGWCAAPPSLDALLESGNFAVISAPADCSADQLFSDPMMMWFHDLGIPVIVAFERAADAHEFDRRIAAEQGRIQ